MIRGALSSTATKGADTLSRGVSERRLASASLQLRLRSRSSSSDEMRINAHSARDAAGYDCDEAAQPESATSGLSAQPVATDQQARRWCPARRWHDEFYSLMADNIGCRLGL